MDKQTEQLIKKEINSHDIVLFMKGTPVFPMCGFSSNIVKVLNNIGTFNNLE